VAGDRHQREAEPGPHQRLVAEHPARRRGGITRDRDLADDVNGAVRRRRSRENV